MADIYRFPPRLRLASVMDEVDRLGDMVHVRPLRFERPKQIAGNTYRLTGKDYPDCILCKQPVRTCGCDPDAYQAALLEAQFGGADRPQPQDAHAAYFARQEAERARLATLNPQDAT